MEHFACAVTGHRPSRFLFRYEEEHPLCKKIQAKMKHVFKWLYEEKKVRRFWVGGALGVDMWAAEQILLLRNQPTYHDMELMVALPFKGYDSKWEEKSRHRMNSILTKCDATIILSNQGGRESYLNRNRYMVDHADYVVAVYDDNKCIRSGTMQCVHYAKRKNIPLILIHPDTADIKYNPEFHLL